MAVSAYYHDDPGAPVLDGTAGSLVQLLKKCLVDGYGDVGQGTWKDPLGWEGLYDSVFQKAGFRSLDTAGTQLWLYVDDSGPDGTDGARSVYVRGYEAFTGFDGSDAPLGLVNPFPTLAQMPVAKWLKSSTEDGTVRPWVVIGDESFVYVLTAYFNPATHSEHFCLHYFGDIVPFRPGDAYHCALACGTAAPSSTYPSNAMTTTTAYALGQATNQVGIYLARSHAQLLDPVSPYQAWLMVGGIIGYVDRYPFPAPMDGGLHMSPLFLVEDGAGLRGQLPGLYGPHHLRPMVHRATIDGVEGLTGRTLQAISTTATNTGGDTGTGRALLDLTGPWR